LIAPVERPRVTFAGWGFVEIAFNRMEELSSGLRHHPSIYRHKRGEYRIVLRKDVDGDVIIGPTIEIFDWEKFGLHHRPGYRDTNVLTRIHRHFKEGTLLFTTGWDEQILKPSSKSNYFSTGSGIEIFNRTTITTDIHILFLHLTCWARTT
jgi:hypothetical protein